MCIICMYVRCVSARILIRVCYRLFLSHCPCLVGLSCYLSHAHQLLQAQNSVATFASRNRLLSARLEENEGLNVMMRSVLWCFVVIIIVTVLVVRLIYSFCANPYRRTNVQTRDIMASRNDSTRSVPSQPIQPNIRTLSHSHTPVLRTPTRSTRTHPYPRARTTNTRQVICYCLSLLYGLVVSCVCVHVSIICVCLHIQVYPPPSPVSLNYSALLALSPHRSRTQIHTRVRPDAYTHTHNRTIESSYAVRRTPIIPSTAPLNTQAHRQ